MKNLRRSVRPGSRGNPEPGRTRGDAVELEGATNALADWESEGGGRGEAAQPTESAAAMMLARGKTTIAGLAKTARQQTRRSRHALGIRRLEARLKTNIDALGHEVFPLLVAGDVNIEAPVVKQRMAVIAALQEELQRQKASMAPLRQAGDAELAKHASIAKVDTNAAEEATRSQSANDANALASGQSPDQGGQG